MTKEEFIYAIETDQSISDEERASLLEEVSTLSEEQLNEGAWGYGVAQNDTFSDYLSDYQNPKTDQIDHKKVSSKVHSNIEKLHDKFKRSKNTFDKDDYSHAIMAGAHAAHSVGFKLNKPHKQAVSDAIHHLSGREASEYDMPSYRRKNLKNFLRKINEEEQLDEISKKTLGSYVKKAADNLGLRARKSGQKEAQAYSLRVVAGTIRNNQTSDLEKKLGLDYKTVSKEEDKMYKRLQGIDRATNRLSREQVENSKGNEEMTDKIVESAASDSLSPSYNKDFNSDPTTRLDAMMAIFGHVAKLPAQDMLDFYDKMIAQIGHEADAIPTGTAEKNKASIKSSIKEEAKSELVAAFGTDETLTEEFKTSAQTIFEAAVNAQVVLEVEEIKTTLENESIKQFENALNDLEDKIDAYVEYAVTFWLEENAVPIESNLRTSITEEFIGKLHQLFTESYFEVPSEKLDIVEMMAEKIAEMEDRMNDLVTENSKLSETVDENTKNSVFDEVSEGLSLTQVDKFKTLTENLDFVNAEDYHKKLQTIRESFKLSDKKTTPSIITEDSKVLIDEEVDEKVARIDPTVEAYMKAIKK